MPPGRKVSIEGEVWPLLVGAGLYGYPSESYWMDIGTPERYLQGTFDILEGNVDTAVRERLGDDWLAIEDGAERARPRDPAGADRTRLSRSPRAPTSAASWCSATACRIGADSTVERAVILAGHADRGRLRAARLHRRRRLPGRATARRVTGGAVLGERVSIGADNVITRGARIFPGVELPDGRSSSEPRTLAVDPANPYPEADPIREAAQQEAYRQMSEGGLAATPAAQELTREAISRIDPSDQLGDVLALPEHLRDALWRVESAIMQDFDTPAGLVVAGMGGSAIGGALARAALGDHASRPIFVTRAYGLPTWTTPDTMVLCASYSGDTEETLACYESAGAARAPSARS